MFQFKRKQYRQKSDEELISIYKEDQNDICLGILYERYGHLVMGTCMKYLKNVQEAEDLTMTIFEKLPVKIVRHQIEFFKSWLYMVTKNECFMLLRKTAKTKMNDDLPDISEDVEHKDHVLSEIQLDILTESIQTLKPDQKQCIELFYLREMSYQQISDSLNMTLMQVKSAIQNGKRNLKIRLEERNEFNTNE